MDEGVKVGLVTGVLGVVILLGLIALAVQGSSYVWLAVLVLGFVAAGLIGVGLYSIMQRAGHSAP